MTSARDKTEIVSVKGPGLVYIEMQQTTKEFKFMQISFFLLLLYFGFYLVILYIVTVERYQIFNDYKKAANSTMPRDMNHAWQIVINDCKGVIEFLLGIKFD